MITNVICPQCAAEVDARAARCTRCGAHLEHKPEPMSSLAKPQPLTDRLWFIVIVLLHVGFLGIPYYLKTGYSLRARLLMCLASIAYTLFAVAVIIWGCMQILKLFQMPA